MSQFPRFRFSPLNRRKTMQPGFLYRLRNVLALGLAALLFLAPLSFTVSAQQGLPGAKVPDGDYFMIYQDENGDSVCRTATLAEKRELIKINTANLGMHRITPATREANSNAKTQGDNATSDNVEPTKIILRGTAQLDNFPEAKEAFNRAALVWESYIQSPIKIYIDVDFGTTNFGQAWSSPDILGSTSSTATSRPYSTVRQSLVNGASTASETSVYAQLPSTVSLPTNSGGASNISISTSIARALGILNPVASETDLASRIGFNSNFQFDFDPSNGISTGKTDFEAVATHEIGHALGFTSRAGATGGATPAIWDLFRFRAGTTLGTFGTAERIMTADGLQYFFVGGSDLGLSTGGPNGDASGGDGNQSSHWKQRNLNGGVYIGIMDPRIPSGTRREITVNDTTALNFFGYNLDNNAQPPPPPPPPPAPANNNFTAAQVLVGCTGSLTSTNISATKESGEPSHNPDTTGHPGSASVWYQWQAPVSSSVTIDTMGTGTDYDTMLAVYTGNAVGSLTPIMKNDDVANGDTDSRVIFNATAGQVYKIAVDGWGGEAGNFVLHWTQSSCSQGSTAIFSQPNQSIGEASGSVAVNVIRANTSIAEDVNYATSDTFPISQTCQTINTGVASSRCDYATGVGTLRFTSGEAFKTIYVPIIDDNIADGNENFTITLTSGGNTLSTATITITDNANGVGNPIDGAEFFIREHYIDFLGREPEPAGLAGWLNVYNNCGTTVQQPCDRTEISSAFFRSPEFQDRASFVYRFYSAVGKIPLYEGFMPDFAKVSGFLSAQQLEANKAAFVQEFMTRADYQNLYGSITGNDAYMTALLNTLGLPNHPNKQAWVNALNGGSSRADVLRAVTEDGQVAQKYYNEAFVIMQYFGYLRRSADASYLNWIQTMNTNGGDYRQMINGFLNSAEYRNRFQ